MFMRGVLTFIFLLCIVPPSAYANSTGAAANWSTKQYTFTKNWFDNRIPSWTRILKEYKGKPGVSYLEIGTFEGRSALWVLENVLDHPTSKLTVIDAFEEPGIYRTFSSNIAVSGDAAKFRVLVGPSADRLKEVQSNSIDFAFIDGSGKGIAMLADLVGVWNLLKLDGIIICSRYDLDERLRKDLELKASDPGPYEAIDAFLKLYKPYIKVLAFHENQVIFRKIRQ